MVSSNDGSSYAPLWRRLAAAVYDGIICCALAMVITALMLPFNDGLAFEPADWRYQLTILLLLYCFFVGFWSKSGQTAGMIAWKITVCDRDGGKIGYKQASLRFLGLSLVWLTLGLGMLGVVFTKRRQALHDWLAETEMIVS